VDTLVVPYEQVAIGLTLLLTPRVSARLQDLDASTQRRWIGKLLLLYVTIGLLYAGFMLAFGTTILGIVFGPELAAGSELLFVMMLLPIVQAFVHSANVGVMALGRPEYNFAGRVLATAGTASIGVVLMLRLGLMGAAFGLVASVALLGAGLWIALFRTWGSKETAEAS
jgi:O-antigen/teichoic acid export membrane protein